VTDKGEYLQLGYLYGYVFDISPLNGISVNLSTSQGIGQIGETVENVSASGVHRTIRGTALNELAAERLLTALPTFCTGKLSVGGCYCNFVVDKSPMVSRKKNGKYIFSLSLYCPFPYWYTSDESFYILNTYIPRFFYPTTLNAHFFGFKSSEGYTIINTDSTHVPVPYIGTFTSSDSAVNYGIVEMESGKKLMFEDTLNYGETVTFFEEGGRVRATKKLADGTQTEILGLLSSDSDLLQLVPGTNIIKAFASEGQESLAVSIGFHKIKMGVLA
jgi:hypothetical protein